MQWVWEGDEGSYYACSDIFVARRVGGVTTGGIVGHDHDVDDFVMDMDEKEEQKEVKSSNYAIYFYLFISVAFLLCVLKYCIPDSKPTPAIEMKDI